MNFRLLLKSALPVIVFFIIAVPATFVSLLGLESIRLVFGDLAAMFFLLAAVLSILAALIYKNYKKEAP
jgi:hypothetical protein